MSITQSNIKKLAVNIHDITQIIETYSKFMLFPGLKLFLWLFFLSSLNFLRRSLVIQKVHREYHMLAISTHIFMSFVTFVSSFFLALPSPFAQITRLRNGIATTSTQVFYERVNRPGVCGSFSYVGCGVKDISKQLADLDKWPALRLRVTKGN